MTDKVKVTPYTLWPYADFAKVEDKGETYNFVPVKQYFETPMDITIYKTQYPNGVVIFNDEPRPSHAQPLDLDAVRPTSSSHQLHIQNDAGWPGCVIIWSH